MSSCWIRVRDGWGDYEGLLAFAASYLSACIKWPNAEVRVSR